LEYWNDGIMGSGKMGIRHNGKILPNIEFNDVRKERLPSAD
jgi:hypothetical protein